MSAGAPLLLADLAWPEVAALVEAGETLCLLPLGATEQHGRHLPLSTDTDIVTAVCREASARTRVPLLPTLWATSSHAHTTRWPGTLSLPPRLVIEVVVELARWIRAAGFRKLLLVNGHGGNLGPLRVAVDEIRCAGDVQVGAASWFDLTPELSAWVTEDAEDAHANAAETALMLHLRPELVARDAIRDDPDRTIGRVFSYTVAETSVDGLTGAPSAATAADGARMFETAVAALAERVERARAETPPALDRKEDDGAGPR